jgi:glutamate--cysteine ligase
MSRDQALNFAPIEDREQLLDYFRSGEKTPERRGVGTEHEKFVFRRRDAQMLSFEEPGGFGDLFQRLADEYGWQPAYDEGHIVALERDGAAITLEPGGQLELSGAIFKTVFETRDELQTHLDEVKALTHEDLAITFWGLNPFYGPDDIPWMPKSRYKIMRRYLPTRGDLALWMMKTTCTIQANFDYVSEDDCADLIRTAVLVSPLVSALFAHSPVKQGAVIPFQSFRGQIWTRTDPDRTGASDFMYRADWGYADYLEYVLDVPMFFIRREQGYIDMAGHSFREFLARGYQGHSATMGDFELHLSTAFPEVRLKRYIEMRGADGGPPEAIVALPALWKGLLYDESARRAAAALFDGVTPEAHREIFLDAYRDGIHGHTSHGSMRELGQELLDIASSGLATLARDAGHEDESVFLAPLNELLETGQSWADRLASDFDAADGNPLELIARSAL